MLSLFTSSLLTIDENDKTEHEKYRERSAQAKAEHFIQLYQKSSEMYELQKLLHPYNKREKQEFLLQLLIKSIENEDKRKTRTLIKAVQKHNNSILQHNPLSTIGLGVAAGLGTSIAVTLAGILYLCLNFGRI